MSTGSYTFRLNRPDATEVYVTGSFDGWSRSAQLHRTPDGAFEGTVQLPIERTLYKFVVDGDWIIDPEAPAELEPDGNRNSILEPSQIRQTLPGQMASSQQEPPYVTSVVPGSTSAALAAQVPIESDQKTADDLSKATVSSAAPQSTTAQLAGQVPLESERQQQQQHQYTIGSAAPQSTTAQLAGQVPLESEKKQHTNGSANTQSTTSQFAEQIFGEDVTRDRPTPTETPALDNVPGFFPDTPASEKDQPQIGAQKAPQMNPIGEQALEEKVAAQSAPPPNQSEQLFSVKPLPPSDTVDNPITLRPGEEVPQLGTQSLTSKVTLDKESYERGAATQYPLGSLTLPEVVTPQEQRDREGRGVLDLPPIVKNMIPESSLPITGASQTGIHHAHVPDVVKESQEKAHAPAEASGVQAAVDKKAELEEELKHEISPAPAISEKPITTTVADTAKQTANTVATNAGPLASAAAENTKAAAGTAATATQNAAGVAAENTKAAASTATTATQNAANTTAETVGPYASALADKAKAAAATVTTSVSSVAAAAGFGSAGARPADNVPEVVQESQAEAGVPPEAAAIPSAVEKKKDFEAELKTQAPEIPPVDTSKHTTDTSKSETSSDALRGGFYSQPGVIALNMAPEDNKSPQVTTGVETHSTPQMSTETSKPVDTVPAAVKDSVSQAGVSAEAAGSEQAVHNKEKLEAELKKEVTPTKPAAESSTLQAATASSPAKATSAPTSTTGSGVYKNGGATAPADTSNGAGAKKSLDVQSPSKQSLDAGDTERKNKRTSFLGKMKEKWNQHKEKKDTA